MSESFNIEHLTRFYSYFFLFFYSYSSMFPVSDIVNKINQYHKVLVQCKILVEFLFCFIFIYHGLSGNSYFQIGQNMCTENKASNNMTTSNASCLAVLLLARCLLVSPTCIPVSQTLIWIVLRAWNHIKMLFNIN